MLDIGIFGIEVANNSNQDDKKGGQCRLVQCGHDQSFGSRPVRFISQRYHVG